MPTETASVAGLGEILVELRGLRADLRLLLEYRAEYDAAITDIRERIAALEAAAARRER
jgi:hypothetical protein